MPTPHPLHRLVLALPTASLMLSGAVLLAVAPFTWGVAAHVQIPDWIIPASVVILALPAFAIGAFTSLKIVQYTSRPFHTFILHLPVGLALPAAAALLFWLSTRITDPRIYDNFRDPTSETYTSPGAVIGMTIMVALFLHLTLLACATLYAEAFSEERRTLRDADTRWFAAEERP